MTTNGSARGGTRGRAQASRTASKPRAPRGTYYCGRDLYRAGRRVWTAADDAALRRTFPHRRTALVAQQLQRSHAAISARAAGLGLHKSAAYLASPDACRLRRVGDDHPGKATQFQPGHVSHNKGQRRPGWAPGRMAETQFKKGQRSGASAAHVMPIGSTRLVEGYVYRKVAEVPNVPYTVNWKAEHVLIWVAAHGPVPASHVVIFTNGNRADVRLDNLACISRRDLMARNTVHNLPPSLKQTVQLLGALNRKLRRSRSDEKQDRRSAESPVRHA